MRGLSKELLTYLLSTLALVGLAFWAVEAWNWAWWQNFASVIHDLGLGLGTVLIGASAIRIFQEVFDEFRKRRHKEKYLKKFGYYKRDTARTLILKCGDPIYALDNISQTIQHIAPFSTFKKLGYPDGGWDNQVTQDVIDDYMSRYERLEDINFL